MRSKKGFTLRIVLFVLGLIWTYSAITIYAEGTNDLDVTLVLIAIVLIFLLSLERVCLDREHRAYWVSGLLLNLPGLLIAFLIYILRNKGHLKTKKSEGTQDKI